MWTCAQAYSLIIAALFFACLIFAVGLDREIILTAKFSRSTVYSPMLKYGSYRSRDLKLRHREVLKGEAREIERLSSPRAIMLRTSSYYKRIGYLACCCTLTSTADFCFLGKAPSQLFYSSFQGRFSRRHLQVYQCSTCS